MHHIPNIDTVYQAISTLYGSNDPSQKEMASVWLGEFQNSVKSLSLFILS